MPADDDNHSDEQKSDAKRKFREALDRKNKQSHRAEDHLSGKSKARGAHGSASHQQQFRRKSG